MDLCDKWNNDVNMDYFFFQIPVLCMTVAEQPFSMKTILFILFSA
ncbi:conserved hypothetical protein [Neisseria gonorrhoeae DGI2]|uniref:Uncharacterized protein n=1 Tax=Neisseria gonorrhoeae (strain NCCP11945) TaxID=521006 RepID=B4RM60_NEIG2|nr:Conserved hypothetical protein [Neisseria gonorrhoeae NCCP11945]EFE04124.1 conserved hypothetical protein [Neisseria gonorrhoeae DGI2]